MSWIRTRNMFPCFCEFSRLIYGRLTGFYFISLSRVYSSGILVLIQHSVHSHTLNPYISLVAKLKISYIHLFTEPSHCLSLVQYWEPRFSKRLLNKVLDITKDILRPGQSYRWMYGVEPHMTNFDITNSSICKTWSGGPNRVQATSI